MEPFSLIIFGITGNLAQIKLLPALYDLAKHDLLPTDFKIIGIGRKPYTKETFEDYIHETLQVHKKHTYDDALSKYICSRVVYLRGDIEEDLLFENIKKESEGSNRMFYLATYPSLYPAIFEKLKTHELHIQKGKWTRLVIEKPLGTNLSSARKLDELLLTHFTEDQIFRLDHYLGKETLQNIIHFRFGNSMLEPLIQNSSIDHIQITSSENFGIGERGGYYDTVGALKDIGQNHLLQMLALATMPSPRSFSNEDITKARISVLKSFKPVPDSLVLGQYEGYTKEKAVFENSDTDTFFAFKGALNHATMRRIPVYIRGGKMLSQSVSEIAIVFKQKGNKLREDIKGEEPNVLFYRIQPNEGIIFKIFVKTPGNSHIVTPTYMQFCYRQLEQELSSPYERLLCDALIGDQTFFNDAPEIEHQWKIIDALTKNKKKPFSYPQGSWGPHESDLMIQKDGRNWIEPSSQFCNF
jgi:glucose-6-phosphate 1-dehydrogenase